jgi:hypothetical protein
MSRCASAAPGCRHNRPRQRALGEQDLATVGELLPMPTGRKKRAAVDLDQSVQPGFRRAWWTAPGSGRTWRHASACPVHHATLARLRPRAPCPGLRCRRCRRTLDRDSRGHLSHGDVAPLRAEPGAGAASVPARAADGPSALCPLRRHRALPPLPGRGRRKERAAGGVLPECPALPRTPLATGSRAVRGRLACRLPPRLKVLREERRARRGACSCLCRCPSQPSRRVCRPHRASASPLPAEPSSRRSSMPVESGWLERSLTARRHAAAGRTTPG